MTIEVEIILISVQCKTRTLLPSSYKTVDVQSDRIHLADRNAAETQLIPYQITQIPACRKVVLKLSNCSWSFPARHGGKQYFNTRVISYPLGKYIWIPLSV